MEGTKIVSYHIKWSTYRTTQTQLGCVRNSFNVSGSQVHSFDLCEILKWPKKKKNQNETIVNDGNSEKAPHQHDREKNPIQ